MSLKRPRDGGFNFCVPVVERPATEDDSMKRQFLGSVRVDFMNTHKAFCDIDSRKFCYARCEILKKKISKMFRGTAAIAITAERMKDNQDHPILIRCNGTAIGSFSGPTAEVIVSGLDTGQLVIQGGEDTVATWCEADFDVFFVPSADGDDATAKDWTQRLRNSCDDFQVDVRAKERVCLSGSCDCCF